MDKQKRRDMARKQVQSLCVFARGVKKDPRSPDSNPAWVRVKYNSSGPDLVERITVLNDQNNLILTMDLSNSGLSKTPLVATSLIISLMNLAGNAAWTTDGGGFGEIVIDVEAGRIVSHEHKLGNQYDKTLSLDSANLLEDAPQGPVPI